MWVPAVAYLVAIVVLGLFVFWMRAWMNAVPLSDLGTLGWPVFIFVLVFLFGCLTLRLLAAFFGWGER